MNPGFHFNPNLCTGCQACVVACQIENGPETRVPWREISTFNGLQHPGLSLFHYSLACNHCDEAPCMSSCPALAYSRNEELNTIVHHADRCIGCKYCTWACPYDAPKFVPAKGVMEKCTFCLHRIEVGSKPACANLCPTGALDYKEISRTRQERIPGFTEVDIGPGIELVRLRRQKPPRSAMQLDDQEESQYKDLAFETPTKVSLAHEWVLVLFTLLVPVLTGLMAAGSLGWMALNPYLFMLAGLTGLLLTSVHLGRKLRAWRSVLNLKHSWLSREVLGYALFLVASLGWFLFPSLTWIGYAAALLGFATSYIIDKVYSHLERMTRLDLQSNNVFLTTLLVTALFTHNDRFAALVLLIKLLLYLYRKAYYLYHGRKVNFAVSLVRIIIGFAVPVWLWFTVLIDPLWITGIILLGEIIDRAEFYAEAEIISPGRQIVEDMRHLHPG